MPGGGLFPPGVNLGGVMGGFGIQPGGGGNVEDMTTQTTLEVTFDYDKKAEIKVPEELKELLGCLTEAEAQELLCQAFEKMDRTKGFRFEGNENVAKSQFTPESKYTLEGVWQNPDLAWVKISKEGAEFCEVYQKGSEMVKKTAERKEWQRGDNRQYQPYPVLPVTQIKTYRQHLLNVRFSREAEIKDKKCKVVKGLLDSQGREKAAERYMALRMPLGTPGSNNSELLYEVWIGESDLLPYKVIFSTKDQTIVLEINLFDYEKVGDIEIPKDVKKLLSE